MLTFETYSLYCLIYLIPGCLFYIFFTIQLFINTGNDLKTPFYGIVKVLAIVDLAAMGFSIISLRMGYLLSQISFLKPLGQNNIFATILAFGTVFFGSVQAFLHVVLAFNRLTAILFPHGYKILWKGKYFYGIISIAFIIPAILFSWILYFGGNVLLSPVFSAYVVDARRSGIPGIGKATITMGIVSSTCFFAFTFDLITFILLKKGNLIKSNISKYKQEFRLLTVSIAFLIVHALFLATAVYTFFFPIRDGFLLLVTLETTTEIQSLISPFCVLLLNQNLRRDLFYQSPKTTVVSILSSRPTIKY